MIDPVVSTACDPESIVVSCFKIRKGPALGFICVGECGWYKAFS